MWVPDCESEGSAGEEVAPHSCEMTTTDGTYHRNQRDFVRVNSPEGSRGVEQIPDQSQVTKSTTNCWSTERYFRSNFNFDTIIIGT